MLFVLKHQNIHFYNNFRFNVDTTMKKTILDLSNLICSYFFLLQVQVTFYNVVPLMLNISSCCYQPLKGHHNIVFWVGRCLYITVGCESKYHTANKDILKP